jgi:threonylcarbamoyladenosine tRNA methylthiotransferase MtaB
MPALHIENFGCRAARADGEAIGARLCALGADRRLAADVVVVNTCSVTAEADRAARAFIRRAHRQNPSARIVVTGCYAQRAPQELAAMPGVAAVVGNSHKALAPEIIVSLVSGHDFPGSPATGLRRWGGLSRAERASESIGVLAPEQSFGPKSSSFVDAASLLNSIGLPSASAPAPIWADGHFAHSFLEEAPLAPGAQTRPYLKVQEGCSNRCSFCVIPFTRGPSRSLPFATVLKQVLDFVAAGGKELVLSGINLGRWGRDLPHEANAPTSLAALVRAILQQTNLPRLRLSSIEPMDWDVDLIALMREFGGRRLARHAHLPLQSASDAVLRRMHRRYRPWHYAEKVAALVRAAGPDLTLGADVMVGFPGETDREFEETLGFLRALPFGYLHLFPFSPRPATPGWALHTASPVPIAAVAERMAALRGLAAEKTRAHRSRFVGRELPAITLHTPPALAAEGRTAALTDNFLPLEIEGRFSANRLFTARVIQLTHEASLCSIVVGETTVQ